MTPYCPQCGTKHTINRLPTDDKDIHFYECATCEISFWVTGWDNV